MDFLLPWKNISFYKSNLSVYLSFWKVDFIQNILIILE